jgi:general secretion pathway protein I
MERKYLVNSSSLLQACSKGFTLLEVVIAMAIMTLAFSSILAVEMGSINASSRAKQMNIVAMLAKNQMVDTEYKIEGKSFDEVKKEDSGTFEAPYQDYRWKTTVRELKFPPIAGGAAAQSKGAEGGNQVTELLTKLITNFLSKALREVTVTVFWKRGTAEQSFSLSTYWVDLNYEFKLTE